MATLPNSGKKRPRDTVADSSGDPAYWNSSTIRLIMGPEVPILSLLDFTRRYAPNLPKLPPQQELMDPVDLRIRHTLICPADSLQILSHCTKAQRGESLDGLVDDVIWSMVHYQSPWKPGGQNVRNVLSNGYVLASEHTRDHVQPCHNMRPGVICHRINSNVSFCKTSTFCHRLHQLVGDDILRVILLYTTVFLPVDDCGENRRGNFLQLSGPPLCSKSIQLPGQIIQRKSNDGIPRKKRKKSQVSDNRPTRRELQGNSAISRQSVFYANSFVPKVGLPTNHELNGNSPSRLLHLILSVRTMTNSKKRKSWKRVRTVGSPLCEQVLKRHSKCDYNRLLTRYCPLPEVVSQQQGNDGNATTLSLPRLSASHSPPEGVVSFLRSALRRVFPLDFWGSEHNFEKLSALAGIYINLRRQEHLTNKALMHGLRTTDMRWLVGRDREGDVALGKFSVRNRKQSLTQHESSSTLSLVVIRWVFSRFINPLLRSCFYITESEMHGRRVLYYRRPVWALFRALSIKRLVQRQYHELSRTEVLARVRNQRMGLSRLRLLPKTSGVRPLALLSTPLYDIEPGVVEGGQVATIACSSKNVSTNTALRKAFEVLRYEHHRQPWVCGAGLFGVNDAYPLLRSFLEQVRSGQSQPPLFFASVDVEHCYDNINQERLLEIISDLLSEDDYLIQNCYVMYPFASIGRIFKRKLQGVGPPESFRHFHAASHDLARKRKSSVFVEGNGCVLAKKEAILDLVEEHLKSHLVTTRGRYGDRFFVQSSGIPQGSILSSLLCNFYYGHVEKDMLDSTIASGPSGSHVSLLLRIVDDFLFITTDQSLSTQFVSIMKEGDDRLGVHINNDKTRVSHGIPTLSSSRPPTTRTTRTRTSIEAQDYRKMFPWCGLMIDTATGEVRLDLSRFSGDKPFDGLTVDRSGSEGLNLRIRMNSFVRPRCLPILFDPTINSVDIVSINFHQIMIICAIKTARYVSDGMDRAERNDSFLLRCIDDVIVYTHKLVAERLTQEGSAPTCFSLPKSSAAFLGRHAFSHVFLELEWASKLGRVLKTKCRSRKNLLRVATMSTNHFHLYVTKESYAG